MASTNVSTLTENNQQQRWNNTCVLLRLNFRRDKRVNQSPWNDWMISRSILIFLWLVLQKAIAVNSPPVDTFKRAEPGREVAVVCNESRCEQTGLPETTRSTDSCPSPDDEVLARRWDICPPHHVTTLPRGLRYITPASLHRPVSLARHETD